MVKIVVEGAWVEFPVALSRGASIKPTSTGGQIDVDRGVVTALRGIDLTLKEGDRLGLIGHNGAGKSTMLRLLAGCYPPTRGRIRVDGRVSTLFSTTPGLNVNGTGRENIIVCCMHHGLSKVQIAKKIDEIIEFAELGDFIDFPIRTYSSGMMTRLAFSIATAVEPEILLLDEGLATGDGRFAVRARAKMAELVDKASILIIASHSMAFIADICNHCIMLEHGQIVSQGPTNLVVENYSSAIIESSRDDNKKALEQAYKLATDMVGRGERPSLQLEEQALRYALRLLPDDFSMWQRYKTVLFKQGLRVPPEVDLKIIILTLSNYPERKELLRDLSRILDDESIDLPKDLKSQSNQLMVKLAGNLDNSIHEA